MPKTISPKSVKGTIQTKAFRHRETNADFVVLSATQDKETSLATTGGSLFTNAIYNGFGQNPNIDFMSLNNNIIQTISKACKAYKEEPYHPTISSSKPALKYKSINQFFGNQAQPQATPKPKRKIVINANPECKEGKLLKFNLDTNGNSGYITIFSIENGKPFIMYKSNKKMGGKFNFPNDFAIKPSIECYKRNPNLAQEHSRVFIILSDRPISNNKALSKGLSIDNGFKGFRRRQSESFEPIIGYFEFVIR